MIDYVYFLATALLVPWTDFWDDTIMQQRPSFGM